MLELEQISRHIAQVERPEKGTSEPCPNKLEVGFGLDTAYIVLAVLGAKDHPIACKKWAASVPRDGVVVDCVGARHIVCELKGKLEAHLDQPLERCAIATPARTDNSLKTHTYVAEDAGMQMTSVLDEPTAANTIYRVSGGVVVGISDGIMDPAALKDGKMVQIEDEPTGDMHLMLALAGSYQIPIVEAEAIKPDFSRHVEVFPVVKAVIEKMAAIVKKYVNRETVSMIYLCGGTCCLARVESIFGEETGIPTYKPGNPLLVTPAGIAVDCIER